VKFAILIGVLLSHSAHVFAQGKPAEAGIRVEVVATAAEYVPLSTTVSRPGHSYTNCLGSTSYFGTFDSYGGSASISGTAATNTHCSSTFSPPSESTLTNYRKVNYTIVKGEQDLYLLSCTQTWRLTAREKAQVGLIGVLSGGSGSDPEAADKARERAKGEWTECPAFQIGKVYALTVQSASDARLESAAVGKLSSGKPFKLEYLASAAPPPTKAQAGASAQSQEVSALEKALVHITSSPSGAEIYVDGKFVGNTPSAINIAAGEHVVKVRINGQEWSRSLQITAGEINVHADLTEK
jgi:hypothetical protein